MGESRQREKVEKDDKRVNGDMRKEKDNEETAETEALHIMMGLRKCSLIVFLSFAEACFLRLNLTFFPSYTVMNL